MCPHKSDLKATLKATQVDFSALAHSPTGMNLVAPTGPTPGPDSADPAQEIGDGRDPKIGVHCTSHHAFIAIVADASVIEREPRWLELPAMESSERLQVFVDDTAREFRVVGASGVALLKAEHAQGHVKVPALYGRAVLENLVRLAAVVTGTGSKMGARSFTAVNKLLTSPGPRANLRWANPLRFS